MLTDGFWRGVGVTRTTFVVESFIDELAQAAKQDPVAYRLALLDKAPRAQGTCWSSAAEKSGWGKPLPAGQGRGVALLQWLRQLHGAGRRGDGGEDGDVRVRRVVCAVDCGIVVNPDTVGAQMESGIVFGITAALWGEITIKNGRVEQTQLRRLPRAAHQRGAARSRCTSSRARGPGGIGEPGTAACGGAGQRGVCRNRKTDPASAHPKGTDHHMSELLQVAAALSRAALGGQASVLATVVRTEGSTYRRIGARMVALPDGSHVGGVSAGCIEVDVILRAEQIRARGTAELVTYDTRSPDDLIWGSGAGCGGMTELLLEPLAPDAALFKTEQFRRIAASRQRIVVATIITTVGNAVTQGDQAILEESGTLSGFDGLDPTSRAIVHQTARQRLEAGSAEAVRHTLNGHEVNMPTRYAHRRCAYVCAVPASMPFRWWPQPNASAGMSG